MSWGSSRESFASVSPRASGSYSRLSPCHWRGLHTINKCRALKIVSGPEKGLSKYYLLLLVKDVLIQCILLVEQIFYGYGMFTQEQANYFFQNNSILLILPNKFLLCSRKSCSLSRQIIISESILFLSEARFQCVTETKKASGDHGGLSLSTEDAFLCAYFFLFKLWL